MKNCSELVLHLLHLAKEPLTVPRIEWQLRALDHWDYDTFDVRDAIHKLIDLNVAEWVHPGRLVQLQRKV